jgi:hypothetical protein
MALVLAHAHTIWSYDGTLTIEQWRELARQRAIDAVLFAEHEETGWTSDRYALYATACARASTPELALIPGIEFNQDGYHVLCYGLREWPRRPSSSEELAAAVHRQGCFLCLAHPARYEWSYPDSLLRVVDAVEVWNSNWVCEGTFGPHPRSLELARGKPMLAGQDVHQPKHLSALYIRTTSDDVLADLQVGRYSFCLGNHAWTQKQLASRAVAASVQRWRTRIVRSGLQSYRWIRRTLRKTSAGRFMWEAAAAAVGKRRSAPSTTIEPHETTNAGAATRNR